MSKRKRQEKNNTSLALDNSDETIELEIDESEEEEEEETIPERCFLKTAEGLMLRLDTCLGMTKLSGMIIKHVPCDKFGLATISGCTTKSTSTFYCNNYVTPLPTRVNIHYINNVPPFVTGKTEIEQFFTGDLRIKSFQLLNRVICSLNERYSGLTLELNFYAKAVFKQRLELLYVAILYRFSTPIPMYTCMVPDVEPCDVCSPSSIMNTPTDPSTSDLVKTTLYSKRARKQLFKDPESVMPSPILPVKKQD